MYGNFKRKSFKKGKKKRLTPTQKAFKAGVKAGMARAGKYRRSPRSRRWF